MFYALCSPTHSRISRKCVGSAAVWHPDLCLWLFREKIDAELVARTQSSSMRKFVVVAMTCPEIDQNVNSDDRMKNARRLQTQYTQSIYDLIFMQSKYDVACHQLKINIEEVEVDDETHLREKKYLRGLLKNLDKHKKDVAETKAILDQLYKLSAAAASGDATKELYA